MNDLGYCMMVMVDDATRISMHLMFEYKTKAAVLLPPNAWIEIVEYHRPSTVTVKRSVLQVGKLFVRKN